jgi:hypothetical protein
MNEIMKLTKTFLMLTLALILLIFPTFSTPDEAMERVSWCVDRDTFDVTLQDYNSSRISEDLIRFSLPTLIEIYNCHVLPFRYSARGAY